MALMERLNDTMRGRKLTNYRLAKDLGLSEGTIRGWRKGTSEPRGKTLLRLAEYLNVSPAWLKYGEAEHLAEKERKLIEKLRQADALGVAEDIDNYIGFLIAQKQQTLPEIKPEKEEPEYPDYLDTLGERLRWLRKAVLKLSEEQFSDELGITTDILLKFERDEEVPDARVLTKLYSEFHDRFSLEWLLTGKTKKEE